MAHEKGKGKGKGKEKAHRSPSPPSKRPGTPGTKTSTRRGSSSKSAAKLGKVTPASAGGGGSSSALPVPPPSQSSGKPSADTQRVRKHLRKRLEDMSKNPDYMYLEDLPYSFEAYVCVMGGKGFNVTFEYGALVITNTLEEFSESQCLARLLEIKPLGLNPLLGILLAFLSAYEDVFGEEAMAKYYREHSNGKAFQLSCGIWKRMWEDIHPGKPAFPQKTRLGQVLCINGPKDMYKFKSRSSFKVLAVLCVEEGTSDHDPRFLRFRSGRETKLEPESFKALESLMLAEYHKPLTYNDLISLADERSTYEWAKYALMGIQKADSKASKATKKQVYKKEVEFHTAYTLALGVLKENQWDTTHNKPVMDFPKEYIVDKVGGCTCFGWPYQNKLPEDEHWKSTKKDAHIIKSHR